MGARSVILILHCTLPTLRVGAGPAIGADTAGRLSCGILHQTTRGFCDNTMPQYFRDYSARYLRPAVLLCLGLAALASSNSGHALTRAELYQATVPFADRCETAPPS